MACRMMSEARTIQRKNVGQGHQVSVHIYEKRGFDLYIYTEQTKIYESIQTPGVNLCQESKRHMQKSIDKLSPSPRETSCNFTARSSVLHTQNGTQASGG